MIYVKLNSGENIVLKYKTDAGRSKAWKKASKMDAYQISEVFNITKENGKTFGQLKGTPEKVELN